MTLALPENYVGLVDTAPATLTEHAEQVQRNFEQIARSWPDVPRFLFGRIDTTAPTILAGTGFTVAKVAVGVATVTYDVPFSTIAVPVLTAETIGSARLANPSLTIFQLALEDNAGALLDGILTFHVMGA